MPRGSDEETAAVAAGPAAGPAPAVPVTAAHGEPDPADVAVAAPQWRISTDRREAARAALAEGADQLHLDFGGAHRGPLLSDPGELRAARAITREIPVPVLAVNHVNDIGLALDHGVANPAAVTLLERALDCARHLGVRVLHVPGFRRSRPTTDALRAGTADALRVLCRRVATAGLILAYESPLGPADSLALARSVGHPALRLVLDTGNLLEAGEDPLRFAGLVGATGLLLPDLHVKEPAHPTEGVSPAPGTVFDALPRLLRHSGARSVLVENDYQHSPTRLRTDITLCRTAVGLSHAKEER
ncbi:sugar phosphate isomerase/epimerase family protein [Streptomyces sp. NRRL B-3648]|uniref:sugar phosphate isomerase/epimerase family protein n=1 Tax=Streptomyces sp. NRRL B-3648 TaxID=1519493 RepID=UPI00099C2265|nr:TIM barrel protein [Streptomyces sp. NRRL B-3648]